jgi:hypothetical protein
MTEDGGKSSKQRAASNRYGARRNGQSGQWTKCARSWDWASRIAP